MCRHLVRDHAISVLNHCLSWYKFTDTHLLYTPAQNQNQTAMHCKILQCKCVSLAWQFVHAVHEHGDFLETYFTRYGSNAFEVW